MNMAKMDKQAIVGYWLDTAQRDYETMQHLFQSGDYHWALFMGHLVLEKLFKALYVQKHDDNPPRTHDLGRLAEKCGLKPDEAMLDKLDVVSRFNLSVRYPDYQQQFYKTCTKDFSLESLKSIDEVRSWLQNVIRQL